MQNQNVGEPSPKEVTQGLCNSEGLQVFAVTILVERGKYGSYDVIKVTDPNGNPVQVQYGGVNTDVWEVPIVGNLIVIVKEDPDGT